LSSDTVDEKYGKVRRNSKAKDNDNKAFRYMENTPGFFVRTGSNRAI